MCIRDSTGGDVLQCVFVTKHFSGAMHVKIMAFNSTINNFGDAVHLIQTSPGSHRYDFQLSTSAICDNVKLVRYSNDYT